VSSAVGSTGDVAVVGGAGFIGRHLVTRLRSEGASVRVVDASAPNDGRDVAWVQCDVRDVGAMTRALAGVRVVYHLAAASGLASRPAHVYDDVNVGGARSVSVAAAEAGVARIVFTSSATVYGYGAHHPDERAPCDPRIPYAASKLAAESVFREWAAGDARRELVIVRPTVVFGPGGRGSGNDLLRRLAAPDYVHKGRPRTRKSLAFVENVAAFLGFVRTGPGGVRVFNYADRPDLELAEIAAIVRSTLGLPAARSRREPLLDTASTVARYAALMSGRPRTDVPPGVPRLTQDVRFDARAAHRSGFVQPVSPHDAIAQTVQADLGLVALVARHR
jgi:nucleoside-diphosphate-sugar epimerase